MASSSSSSSSSFKDEVHAIAKRFIQSDHSLEHWQIECWKQFIREQAATGRFTIEVVGHSAASLSDEMLRRLRADLGLSVIVVSSGSGDGAVTYRITW